jgi:hypothetical protein
MGVERETYETKNFLRKKERKTTNRQPFTL